MGLPVTDKDVTSQLRQALASHRQGRFDEARGLYEQILQQAPTHFEALYLLATLHAQCGQALSAIGIFDRALSIHPHHAGTHNNLGNALMALQRFEPALQHYLKAIELKPDFVEAHNNHGHVLLKLQRYEEALRCFDALLAWQPMLAEAHNNRGVALKELQRYPEALACYDQAIALKPDYVEAYSNRGNALQKLQRFEASLPAYAKAIALDPDHYDAHYNQANALQELRRFEQALDSFDRAIACQPERPDAHWNKALALLLLGDWAQGWALYDWRWRNHPSVPQRTFAQPRWTGQADLSHHTLLLHAEQGIGDVIQFGSLIPELMGRCARVIFQVDPRLLALFQRALPDAVQLVSSEQALGSLDFDFHLPVASLGRILRSSAAAFEGHSGHYLHADPQRVAQLQAAHFGGHVQAGRQTQTPKFRCGITWRSRSEKNGQERSLALQDLVRALHTDGLEFINLQYGDTAAEVQACAQDWGIEVKTVPEVDNFQDLDGLAALMACCDWVITVDNSTAHLAGALGLATGVLLTHVPDWRWQLDRADSPWYASLKLYRQGPERRWEPVLAQVKQDLLRNLCSSFPRPAPSPPTG